MDKQYIYIYFDINLSLKLLDEHYHRSLLLDTKIYIWRIFDITGWRSWIQLSLYKTNNVSGYIISRVVLPYIWTHYCWMFAGISGLLLFSQSVSGVIVLGVMWSRLSSFILTEVTSCDWTHVTSQSLVISRLIGYYGHGTIILHNLLHLHGLLFKHYLATLDVTQHYTNDVFWCYWCHKHWSSQTIIVHTYVYQCCYTSSIHAHCSSVWPVDVHCTVQWSYCVSFCTAPWQCPQTFNNFAKRFDCRVARLCFSLSVYHNITFAGILLTKLRVALTLWTSFDKFIISFDKNLSF